MRKSNATQYGVTVLRGEPQEDHYICDAEFVTAPPTPFRYFQWSRATYEWGMQEVGFLDFTWRPTEVAPEDVTRYGEAYWQDMHDNNLVIGLVCQK